jgi:hypothetical protein
MENERKLTKEKLNYLQATLGVSFTGHVVFEANQNL